MLIRCTIWFSVNCFRIHIAHFSQLPKQTEREVWGERERVRARARRQRDREREQGQRDRKTNRDRGREKERGRDQTASWKLFQCSFSASEFFFGNFIEKLFSESKASSFPFIKT